MTPGSKTILAVLLLCAAAHGEALSLAGFVVRLPDGVSAAPYALQNSRYGDSVAALSDPRDLLRESEWAILQVETTDTFAHGLPVLEVVEVLPEFWQQPAIWSSWGKDFGTWAGVGSRAQPADYAGAPLEDRRAYHYDNGLLNPLDFGDSGGSHPPVVLLAELTALGLQLTWNVQAGSHYDILGSGEVASGYVVVGNVTAGSTGTVSFTIDTTSPRKFFKIKY